MIQLEQSTVEAGKRATGRWHGWSICLAAAIALALALVNPASAQEGVEGAPTVKAGKHLETPYLWRIERDPPSFLFGTIHIPDPRVTRVPPTVLSAIAASDVVYTEVPMDFISTTSAALKVMDLAGPGLSGQLPPATYARAKALLAARNLDMAGFEKMRVWSFMSMLPMLDYLDKAASNQALDQVIYSRASRLRKKVGGIETIDEQFGYFERFTLAEQIHLLEKTLDHIEETAGDATPPSEELIEAYASGDPAVVMEYATREMDLEDPVEKRFFDAILVERNRKMADRVQQRLDEQPGQAFLFAFGLLHFPGDEGVIELLEARGWKIVRVPPDTEFAPRPTPTPRPLSTPTSNPFAP